MTRRIDFITAEKVSLALLTRAAFGLDAGMWNAKHFNLPARLAEVFSRKGKIRTEVRGIVVMRDRRRPGRHRI